MPLNFTSDSERKNLLYICQKIVSYTKKRTGKTFSCHWLFIYSLLKKRTVPLGKNSCKHNYFLDGKQSMENFDTLDLHRFVVKWKIVHVQQNSF